MFKKAINIAYLILSVIMIFCVPLSGIFLIVRICGASEMSWIGCCIPLIIAIAIFPFWVVCKTLINDETGV